MSVVYYYAKKELAPIFLQYGIRLSKNYDYEFNVSGYQKPYLIGLLNPKDDMEKYHSEDYICLKLDVIDTHLLVADFSLPFHDHVIKDFKLISHYVFGTYLKPRVLIDTSVIGDKISSYDSIMDIPLVYQNSEDFFYEVQIQKLLQELPLEEAYRRLNQQMP